MRKAFMSGALIGMLMSSVVVMAEPADDLIAVVAADPATKAKLEQYVKKVNDAVKLVDKMGLSGAEPILLDKKGEFFFDGDMGYIFIIDTKGNTHLNAAKPSLKGKNLLAVKDVKGYPFFGAFIRMAKKYNEGWVEYWWPKPGVTESSVKVSFVKMLNKDGMDYIVGAGPYDMTLGDIYKVFPEERQKI